MLERLANRHTAVAALPTAAYAVLVVALLAVCLLVPKAAPVPLHATAGSAFTFNGEDPSSNAIAIHGPRYGSWSGSDANTGTLASDDFTTNQALEVALSGFPANPRLGLYLERDDGKARLLLTSPTNYGRQWTRHTFWLPADWVGSHVRLYARDDSRAADGWLGVADVYSLSRPGWVLVNYGWWALKWLLLGGTALLAVFPVTPGALFCATTLTTLLAFRLPSILSGQLFNPDEAQMTAQAITFLHRATPWLDVDGTTSGPLNSMFVALPGVFSLVPTLNTSRLLAALYLAIALIFLYLALRLFCFEGPSRLATLLALACLGAVTEPSVLAYASETVPIMLIAIVLWVLALSLRRESLDTYGMPAAAVLIGSLPFTKLQAVPFAILLAAVALWIVWTRTNGPQRWRSFAAFALGLAAVPLIFVGWVTAKGAFRDFWTTYVIFPRMYVSGNCCNVAGPGLVFADRAIGLFVSVGLIATIGAGCAVIVLRGRLGRVFAFFVVMTCIAVYAIEVPQTPFVHYLLWLVLPIAGLVAGSLAALRERLVGSPGAWAALTACVAFAFLLPAVDSPFRHPLFTGPVSLRVDAVVDPVVPALRRFIAPGASVAMWGWMPQYPVYTGAVMGTRDSISQFQIEGRPLQAYYRARYIGDLVKKQPDFLLEAIGPSAFAYHDPAGQGIASFPELRDFVASHYRLAFQTDSLHLYQRDPEDRK